MDIKRVAPHVTVETVDLGSSDYMNMLQTQLAGGADFDVVTIKDIPGYANLVATDQLEPLNDFIAAEGIDTRPVRRHHRAGDRGGQPIPAAFPQRFLGGLLQ